MYSETAYSAVNSSVDERAAFISKTYLHLIGAIVLFVAGEAALFKFTDLPEKMLFLIAENRFYWLGFLVAFMGAGYVAEKMARKTTSIVTQYAGLGIYVAFEIVLFMPLLAITVYFSGDPNILPTAAIATLAIFGTLTAIVFATRKDFSFMKGALALLSILALGIIVVSIVFGFELGPIFSVAMIGLAAGYVLYYTSNVLHHYRTDQHVAAALALFAAIALLFWYVLRLLNQIRR